MMAEITNHVVVCVEGCLPNNSDEEDSEVVEFTERGQSIPRQVPILNSLFRQYSSFAWDSNSNRVEITIVTLSYNINGRCLTLALLIMTDFRLLTLTPGLNVLKWITLIR